MPDRQTHYRNALAMRREPTSAERIMWRLLRGGQIGGLKFRRQVPIGDYIADFACFDPRIIIECDGGQHADSVYDAARDAWFRARGFQIFRFWNGEVIDNSEGVAETLLRTYGKGD
jgi:very-short-patch-repair endonuclease